MDEKQKRRRKGMERIGKTGKGKERKGGRERKGEERKRGKERKGKEDRK